MKTSILIPGVALAIGLGVGFGLGKNGGTGSTSDTTADGVTTRAGDRVSQTGLAGDRKNKPRNLGEIYAIPGQSSRVQALLDFYSNLGPGEFQAEAEKLESLPFNERILASVLLFGKWAEVDPNAAMAFTDTMGMAGGFVRPTVLQGWASTDPVNAAKYYTENPAQFAMMNMMGGRGARGGMGMQGPGGIIAGEWAKQDPAGAMEWAQGLKTNSGEAMVSVVSEVAKTDPKKAAEMAASMDEGSRGGAYETIAKQWGASNFSEAQAWANGLPEDQRGAAMAAAISGLAQKNPELAAMEIGKMTDMKARSEAIPTVVSPYARRDPQGSMTWLKSLNDDDAVRDSMREVMPIWAAADSAAALDFVKSQTSPQVRDSAAQSYVWSDRTSSPQELMAVAGMITDERDKSRTTGMVAARWLQEDKEAATKFISGSDAMSDNVKERLLSGGSPWGDRGRGRGRGR